MFTIASLLTACRKVVPVFEQLPTFGFVVFLLIKFLLFYFLLNQLDNLLKIA
jgi:hypothetical protein